MTFQPSYIILDAVFKMKERKEVYGVDGGLFGLGVTFLEDTMEIMVRNGEHTAMSMVDNGDFVRAEELLRNDERAKGSLAIRRGSRLLGKLEGSTYAAPPALRMTCASPSLRPRAAAGLVNRPQSVQPSRYRESNGSYSIRASMQVTTANFLPGLCESDHCRSWFKDRSLV